MLVAHLVILWYSIFFIFIFQGARDENPNVNKKATLADTKSLLKVANLRTFWEEKVCSHRLSSIFISNAVK